MSRLLFVALVACSSGSSAPPPSPPRPPSANALKAPDAFAAITDRAARSRALFTEASRVLTHARCVNCHPADDSPRQGDAHVFHDPPVVRGPDNHGVPALQCQTCHQDANVQLARVPGAPDWHLAPLAMAWIGRTPGQICAQLKDPARNGGKSLAQIQEHTAHDKLVAWGWAPGADRTAPPGSQREFAALVQAWIDTGAECP